MCVTNDGYTHKATDSIFILYVRVLKGQYLTKSRGFYLFCRNNVASEYVKHVAVS